MMVSDIAVGVTCNNCCIMCTNIMPPPTRWDASTEDIERMVRSFDKKERKIVLTGGEPSIRSDFLRILRFIKKERPDSRTMVLTNGRIFCYPEFTKKFISTGCDWVAIPLHAHKAELHDMITRAPGSFEQTVQGIRNLLDYQDEVDLDVRVVIHRLNYKHLPALAKFISNEFNGLHQVVLFPIDIIGNANINRKELLVKITEVKPYLERALNTLEKNDFDISLFHIPFCVLDRKYWKNVAGRTVEDRRITFEPCGECIMREKCPGIWRTYAFRVGTAEFKPIRPAPKTIYTKSPNLNVR
ncbi:MAG: hypothetical protein Sv326_1206 [Candidatus Fermentimicrarchaeum limneticum]|uniref:Radical SAM core domain-containing protein n=1 Tax=Fermentimicrarchaeum limneticum TaxID=2795018 RepID=A0A7D6BTF8_FERL1|nr:MAG: hypothetical protein Sv326_1206 [Candidatus Fermentimicrarchaeum limneticum]